MPKMLIEISENDYNTILIYRPHMSKYSVDVDNLTYVLQNGTVIPDNATNGKVIETIFKALFPQEEIYTECAFETDIGRFDIDIGDFALFDEYWWGKPYKGE